MMAKSWFEEKGELTLMTFARAPPTAGETSADALNNVSLVQLRKVIVTLKYSLGANPVGCTKPSNSPRGTHQERSKLAGGGVLM